MPLFGTGRGDTAPRAWVSAVHAVLKFTPERERVVGYVLTGKDAGVLNVVDSVPAIAGPPQPVIDPAIDVDAMAAVYSAADEVDAVVLRRWGRVLEAANGPGTWGLTFGDIRGGNWFDLMVRQAFASRRDGPLPLSYADVERIAAVDGAGPAEVLSSVFRLQPYARYGATVIRKSVHRLPGFVDALTAHREVVNHALTGASVDERLAAVSVLENLDAATLAVFAEALAEASTTGSQQVRDAMRPLLARTADAAVSPLRALGTDAKPAQRAFALELLTTMPEQRDWALQVAAADRAASVQAVAARAEATPSAAVDDLVLPDLTPLPSWTVPAATAEALAKEIIDDIADAARARNHQIRQHRAIHPHHAMARELPVPERAHARELARLLAADEPIRTRVDLELDGSVLHAGILVLDRDDCPLAASLQVIAALGLYDSGYGNQRFAEVVATAHHRTGEPDLTTIARMLDALGQDGRERVWRSYCSSWGTRLGRDWPDEQVWPFVARNLDWILEGRRTDRWGWDYDHQAFFAALATFPTLPAAVIEPLYAMALDTRKGDRAPAQEALARDPQRGSRAAAALADGRSEVRLVAAQWLTRIADPATLPALQAAWKKEKQDVVRGALLDALIAVGEDAETYLDPTATTATAEKLVAKGLPAPLAWLDWESVPEVTWASSGDPVPRVVVQWLCAVAVKTKSPEPDAILRQYAALFEPAGRESLAAHLLAAWLTEDVRPISPADAEQLAAQQAASYHHWYATTAGSPYFGMTVEQVAAAMLPEFLRQPAGSTTSSKGLLAVVAACGGRDVVPLAERYLRQWYGMRTAQGKALIGMLAWVDHPSATQLVLSIGSRFRTKSFQDEAIRQAQALAERKGWTVDELADRTIPTAGFDDAGVLTLSYGPRTFTATLKPNLTLELRDPDGKAIKALPAPRQSDDADQVKEAKKAFTGAKKELKGIATLQTQRLYEAMCTERSWSVEDWEQFLLPHPVVGPAVRRLVWVATPKEAETTPGNPETLAFRPLDDGSLTDVDDNEVSLPVGGRIRIAHDSILAADQVARWTEHLADYEVTPLFEQLGRGVHPVAAEMRSQREITDFQGHLLEAFSLRGRAGKLGYARGQSEDGGWFYTYDKRFPTLGITATIAFTGNGLPEENRTVALTALGFRRDANGQQHELTLGDVPAVLVSECWHDMRLIAADGTGFDPDWQKKTEY